MQIEYGPTAAAHLLILRAAGMPHVPQELEPAPAFVVNLVELVEQDGAGPLIEKVGNRRPGAEGERVRPEHEAARHLQGGALAAVWPLADQRHARRDLEPRVDMREANPQCEDGGGVGGIVTYFARMPSTKPAGLNA